MAIINLNEEQIIHDLYEKYWKKMDGGGKCEQKEKDEHENALKMENLQGVFAVVVGGCIIALFTTVVEFLWKASKNAKKDEVNSKGKRSDAVV